jgi:hypothetical protein
MPDRAGELSLTQQRDRFVTFAFVAADILLETDPDGVISYATGSTQSLLQRDTSALEGQGLGTLAMPDDAEIIPELLARIVTTGRVRDVAVRFAGTAGAHVSMLVSGMKSPYDARLLQLTVRSAPLANAGAPVGAADSPVPRAVFAEQVAQYAKEARESKNSKNLTFYDVSAAAGDKDLSQPENAPVVERLEKCLGAWSSGGTPAGKLDHGRYGVVLDSDVSADALGNRLGTILADGGAAVPVPHASLDISEPVETDRFAVAVNHAIESFLLEGPSHNELESFAKCIAALDRQDRMDKPQRGKVLRKRREDNWL